MLQTLLKLLKRIVSEEESSTDLQFKLRIYQISIKILLDIFMVRMCEQVACHKKCMGSLEMGAEWSSLSKGKNKTLRKQDEKAFL